MNIWQSYKQECGCLVACEFYAPGHNTANKVHDTIYLYSRNYAKRLPILIFFTGRLSNKLVLIWLLSIHHTLNMQLNREAERISTFLL